MNSVRITRIYEILEIQFLVSFFLERPIKMEPMDEYEPPIPRIDKFDRPIKLEPIEPKYSPIIKTEEKSPSESKSKSSKSSSSSSPHKSHHKHNSSSTSSKEIKELSESSERRKQSKHHEKRDKRASSGQPEKSHTSSKRKHNDSPINSKEVTSDDERVGATASKYQKIDSQSSRSSKSSHKDKDKERHKYSDSSKHTEKSKVNKTDKEERTSSSSSKKHSSSKKTSSSSSHNKKDHHKSTSKSKNVAEGEDEELIDNSEGMGFAEALAMFDMPSTSRKKDSCLADKPIRSSVPAAKKPHSDHRSSTVLVDSTIKILQSQPSMLRDRSRLDPLPDITTSFIPEYKPMPMNAVVKDYLFSSLAGNGKPPKPEKTDKELEFESFSSKANRTKVFSGNKQQQRSDIPTLYEMCIRILQENIDFLETTGGIPFDILRPVLERAKPNQLANIEYYNPYLLEESDVLWEPHCKRKFRTKKREEMEAWREMYEVSKKIL